MKPIIIYEEAKDNKITLTKEQFEQNILDAYNVGVEDGEKTALYVPYNPSVPTIKQPYITDTPSLKPPYEITCDGTGENPMKLVQTSDIISYNNKHTKD